MAKRDKKQDQRSKEEIENKKKALLKAINDLKEEDPTISDEDINILAKAVDEIVELESIKWYKKLFNLVLSFILKYIVMFISMTIVASFFINRLSIAKPLIFLVVSILAIPYTMLHSSHIFGIKYWDKSFLPKFLIATISFIVAVCLINEYQFEVLIFTSDWIMILVFTSLLYMLLDFELTKRLAFY